VSECVYAVLSEALFAAQRAEDERRAAAELQEQLELEKAAQVWWPRSLVGR
jgi:hypothetical protein